MLWSVPVCVRVGVQWTGVATLVINAMESMLSLVLLVSFYFFNSMVAVGKRNAIHGIMECPDMMPWDGWVETPSIFLGGTKGNRVAW